MKPSEFVKEHRWCQYHLAVDKNNFPVSFESPKADAFCIAAIIFLSLPPPEATLAIDLLSKDLGHSLTRWNDRPNRTKREVIELLESHGL